MSGKAGDIIEAEQWTVIAGDKVLEALVEIRSVENAIVVRFIYS